MANTQTVVATTVASAALAELMYPTGGGPLVMAGIITASGAMAWYSMQGASTLAQRESAAVGAGLQASGVYGLLAGAGGSATNAAIGAALMFVSQFALSRTVVVLENLD